MISDSAMMSDEDFVNKVPTLFTEVYTDLRFSILPRKCKYSGKSLFFRKAVTITLEFFPFDAHTRRWYDPKAYTLLRMKG